MKRSKTARLVLMGLSPIVLTACETKVPATVYDSVENCKAAGKMTAAQCESAFAQAKVEHERVAPRYTSLADCEKDFGVGKCVAPSAHQGGMNSYFIPLMSGYLLANILRPNEPGYNRNSGMGYSQPLYRTPSSGYRTAGGDVVADRPGSATVSKSVTTPQTRAVTMSRSGFGSTATARSSWGG